ncbi:hypothetical protein SprV_0301272700 [Sparganum proliferum]
MRALKSPRGIDANDGGGFASPERQAEAHQPIVDVLRKTGQSSHGVVPDGKGDARTPSLCFETTAPETLAGTYLQLALFGETGLAECRDLHLVARQFPSH